MWTSANERQARHIAERRDLTPVEAARYKAFLDETGSLTDRLPTWINWLIGIGAIIYFGGGLLAPFFW